MDLTTAEGVVARLEQTTNEDNWNQCVEEMQKANGGNYPDFWWEAVVESGLYQRKLNQFGHKEGIILSVENEDGSWSDVGSYDVTTGKRIT